MENKIIVDELGTVRDQDGFCVECAVTYCECDV